MLVDLPEAQRAAMLEAADGCGIAWARGDAEALKIRFELAKLYAQCGKTALADLSSRLVARLTIDANNYSIGLAG